MSVVAAVFPGQGSERPGVGLEWLEDPLVAFASECCGADVGRALQRFGPELRRTSVLQPALVALSLVAWRRARSRGVEAALVCGHSVGEIAAWAAAGAIDERQAVRLAAARGAAMERAALASPGAMIALPGGADVGLPGLELAARNGPLQRVYSGSEDAIAAAARALGGRRLDVSGPWHSRAMAVAESGLREALAAITSEGTPGAFLVTCLDGRKLARAERPDLAAQLTNPVAWSEVMATLAAEGVTDAICLAPGRTSRGLLRDGLGAGVRLHVVESEADCDRLQLAASRTPRHGASP